MQIAYLYKTAIQKKIEEHQCIETAYTKQTQIKEQ